MNYSHDIYSLFVSATAYAYNYFSSQNLYETFMLVDGLAFSITFIQQLAVLNMSKDRISQKLFSLHEKEIVKKCTSIYVLDTLDRYILYYTVHLMHSLYLIAIHHFIPEFTFHRFATLLILLFAIPVIQNRIMNIKSIHQAYFVYKGSKISFTKYIVSNIIIHFIQHIHPQIRHIANYNIFLIHNNITAEKCFDTIKNATVICLLYFLKVNDSFYYYYKSIKIAYSYHTGYTFNAISCENAVYITNKVIKEKRWDKLSEIENINALYVLVTNKFQNRYASLNVTIQLLFLKFCCIWSAVSFMRIIYGNIYLLLLVAGLAYKYTNPRYTLSILIVYTLIFLRLNDLSITISIAGQPFVYYITTQIFFFYTNFKDIHHFLRKYKKFTLYEDYDIVDVF